MKSIKFKIFISICLVLLTLSSCELELQTDAEYTGEALDPHINMTAWDYIQSNPDLSDMMDAIEYVGIDSVYSQTTKNIPFWS